MNKLFAALISLALFACTSNKDQKTETSIAPYIPLDPHSYSQPERAVVTHLDLDMVVNFEEKQIEAVANWKIKNNGFDTIVFDTYGLDIEKITLDNTVNTTFKMGEEDPVLGQKLAVVIQPNTAVVNIYYKTTNKAKALQWLDQQQTNDKTSPFLFTQSQAILARTWLPCQDSPGIRYTYNAKAKVPSNLMALMSAENPMERNETGEYTFKMDKPIPSYLMALAVGDVEFTSISDRAGIYAEPGMLVKSKYEFADMETMIVKAEELYGPYAWGRYDLIVLPPSFPFGGMENPMLTFATPTILAGDRSLVALVAHELAHSWSGNLVTNQTWNDFWLNEGFTVYFEMRIMEAVYGRGFSEMNASISHQDMLADVADISKENPEDTHLKLNLAGRDPDDGMTSIAYDKGYHFLRLCEETVGREKWDAFLKNYFQGHKFQVMNTEEFLTLLKTEVLSEEQQQSINIDAWVYGPGVPENAPVPQSDKFAKVETAMATFLETNYLPKDEETDRWTSHQWVHFLRLIPDDVTLKQIQVLNWKYKFTQSGNNEVLAAWWQPVIKTKFELAYPRMETFLITVGRRKFLTPTYKTLKETGQIKWALETYKKARPNYHAVSRESMDNLLGYAPE